MRWRPLLSLGVIAALGVAVWAALSAGSDEPSPTTSTAVTVTTASTTSTTTTTTTVPTTSTTELAATTSVTETTTDPEARLEEVRLILEDLYYRWFDAIYRNDEEAVREVVATEERLGAFREMAASHQYETAPTRDTVRVTELKILRDSSTCLAVSSTLDLSDWLGDGMTSSGVDVLWSHNDGWRRATLWANEGDLWEADCEASRADELP